VVATLRDYLRIEYRVKEGRERDFNKDTIKGSTPKVPQQTNFTDCGVYVLQYVESFFQVTLNKLFTVASLCSNHRCYSNVQKCCITVTMYDSNPHCHYISAHSYQYVQ
jgi:hypothetical protein